MRNVVFKDSCIKKYYTQVFMVLWKFDSLFNYASLLYLIVYFIIIHYPCAVSYTTGSIFELF